MKKILTLLTVFAVMATVLALTSCGHIHTLSDPVKENEVEPTCRKSGSYDEVIYCLECEVEFSRKTKRISRLPHDYVDGLCSVCGFEESETPGGSQTPDGGSGNPDGGSGNPDGGTAGSEIGGPTGGWVTID